MIIVYVFSWDEWDEIINDNHDQDITCPRCKTSIDECPCITWQVVEMENLETFELFGKTWAIQQTGF